MTSFAGSSLHFNSPANGGCTKSSEYFTNTKHWCCCWPQDVKTNQVERSLQKRANSFQVRNLLNRNIFAADDKTELNKWIKWVSSRARTRARSRVCENNRLATVQTVSFRKVKARCSTRKLLFRFCNYFLCCCASDSDRILNWNNNNNSLLTRVCKFYVLLLIHNHACTSCCFSLVFQRVFTFIFTRVNIVCFLRLFSFWITRGQRVCNRSSSLMFTRVKT